jgi:hypothetical protein
MKGVEFVVDDSGKKKAVLIDLEHWGDLPTVSWSGLKLETDLVDQR